MVDNVYRGRGDTTNIQLTDAEVRRIRADRAQAVVDIRQLLTSEVERDPIAGDERQLGHLFLVAEPEHSEAELLVSVAGVKWRRPI